MPAVDNGFEKNEADPTVDPKAAWKMRHQANTEEVPSVDEDALPNIDVIPPGHQAQDRMTLPADLALNGWLMLLETDPERANAGLLINNLIDLFDDYPQVIEEQLKRVIAAIESVKVEDEVAQKNVALLLENLREQLLQKEQEDAEIGEEAQKKDPLSGLIKNFRVNASKSVTEMWRLWKDPETRPLFAERRDEILNLFLVTTFGNVTVRKKAEFLIKKLGGEEVAMEGRGDMSSGAVMDRPDGKQAVVVGKPSERPEEKTAMFPAMNDESGEKSLEGFLDELLPICIEQGGYTLGQNLVNALYGVLQDREVAELFELFVFLHEATGAETKGMPIAAHQDGFYVCVHRDSVTVSGETGTHTFSVSFSNAIAMNDPKFQDIMQRKSLIDFIKCLVEEMSANPAVIFSLLDDKEFLKGFILKETTEEQLFDQFFPGIYERFLGACQELNSRQTAEEQYMRWRQVNHILEKVFGIWYGLPVEVFAGGVEIYFKPKVLNIVTGKVDTREKPTSSGIQTIQDKEVLSLSLSELDNSGELYELLREAVISADERKKALTRLPIQAEALERRITECTDPKQLRERLRQKVHGA